MVKGHLLCAGMALLSGCRHVPLLSPQGPVGETQRFVMVSSFALMLVVVVPVVVMVLLFPMRYRASKSGAPYAPEWHRSKKIEWAMWLVPAILVAILSGIIWVYTLRLDPYRPLDTAAPPITINAVSMDWKWLFIYPEQNIAAVNQVVFPVNVPVRFNLTSDTVMTSFFIPRLGSQIYAMAGMTTRLHLMAGTAGNFTGQNQQFSGAGYADMQFSARAVSADEFKAWIARAKKAPERLDMEQYKKLAEPGTDTSATVFAAVRPNLFEQIVNQYVKTSSSSQISAADLNHKKQMVAVPEEEVAHVR